MIERPSVRLDVDALLRVLQEPALTAGPAESLRPVLADRLAVGRAFSTTSLSTQPPDTEPQILPDSEIPRLAPIGLGAERRVATTVATTTRSPGASGPYTSLANDHGHVAANSLYAAG